MKSSPNHSTKKTKKRCQRTVHMSTMPAATGNEKVTVDTEVHKDSTGATTSSNVGSAVVEENDEAVYVILDPVLGYLSYGLQSGTVTNAKKAALGHFTSTQIKKAKEVLYDKCKDLYEIGPYYNRRDSTTRSEHEANIHDIVTALQQLDTKYENPPVFAVPAADLKFVPRSHPEELNLISFVDRLGDLENIVRDMRIQFDRSTAENISIKSELQSLRESRPTYASVVTSVPRVNGYNDAEDRTHIHHDDDHTSQDNRETANHKPEGPDSTAQRMVQVRSADHPPSERNSSMRGRGRGRGATSSIQRGGPSQRGSSSQNGDRFSTEIGPQSTDTGQWEVTKSKKRTVTGKLQNCAILGAPEPGRDAFIYRVHSQVDTEELEQYIREQKFDIKAIKCVSREESKFKSFKLTVPVSQFARLFDENLWPAGIRVRKFVTKRKFPGEDDEE